MPQSQDHPDGSTVPNPDQAGGADKPDSNATDGGPQGGGLPTRPPRQVYLSPADISTAVQTSALEMWVDGKQGDLGEAQLQELAAAVSLVTWPELGAAAFSLTAVDASNAGDQRAHVTIAPADELESRWYALVVKSLPTGFQWWNAPGSRVEKVARFRTDSMPVIASVTRCDKGGISNLLLRFSEIVSSADAQEVSVEGASCEPVVQQAQTVDSLELNCSTNTGTDDLTFTFGKAAAQRADKGAWLDVGDGCFDFVPKQLAP